MNTSQKCNCCVKEDVCKYKKDYKKAVDAIMECNVANRDDSIDDGYSIIPLREAKFVEVSIKCPFMTTAGGVFRTTESQ